jgi:hypothetical protein
MRNRTRTPTRAIRISDELWQAAQARAAENGEYVTDVIRRALERYTKKGPGDRANGPGA